MDPITALVALTIIYTIGIGIKAASRGRYRRSRALYEGGDKRKDPFRGLKIIWFYIVAITVTVSVVTNGAFSRETLSIASFFAIPYIIVWAVKRFSKKRFSHNTQTSVLRHLIIVL
jgi:hypothetical protein